ncbi:hypothetical protein [Haloferax sp. YSSS75]|uniref:DUF7261 family protein n=1 Tax=Haloferax sp. YSSS75 TaxID=3388564 RepID=UPI00398CF44C
MADVNLPSRLSEENRGQLFLVTALAVAVMLVSLALVLNTAIYTENIATRTTDTQLDEAASSQRAAVTATGTILDAENRDGGGTDEIDSRFDSAVGNWSSTASTLEAANGFSVDVSYDGTNTSGLRIHQDDPSRNFTDNTPSSDWQVVNDGRVRGVWFNLSRADLATTESDAFEVRIKDESSDDDVEVKMYTDGTNVTVTVRNDTGLVGTCDVEPPTGDSLVVDVGNKVVGNQYCAPLEVAHDELDGDVDVHFDNPENATGTYELYATDDDDLDDLDDLLDGGDFASPGSGWPVRQDAIYDANVTFVFHASGTTVEKEIRIAPGEL